jgi:hypothetical protein
MQSLYLGSDGGNIHHVCPKIRFPAPLSKAFSVPALLLCWG